MNSLFIYFNTNFFSLTCKKRNLKKGIVLFVSILWQSFYFAQPDKIIKSNSYYYLNDSIKIVDSMFTTVRYYDLSGNLYKAEEAFYLYGKKKNSTLAIYKDEYNIKEMYNDGILILKLDYDSLGTVTKEFVLINSGKETIVTEKIPIYKNNRLIELRERMKTETWTNEMNTYYIYEDFPDSNIVVESKNYGDNMVKQTKCFTNAKKLLYEEMISTISGHSYSHRWNHKYNSNKQILEKIELENNIVVAEEIFNYKNEKLFSSTLRTKKKLVKTFYE